MMIMIIITTVIDLMAGLDLMAWTLGAGMECVDLGWECEGGLWWRHVEGVHGGGVVVDGGCLKDIL